MRIHNEFLESIHCGMKISIWSQKPPKMSLSRGVGILKILMGSSQCSGYNMPPAHCVLKWGFTRTFPGNQDETLKKILVLTFI